MHVVTKTPTMLSLEHKPRFVPAIALLLVIGVVAQALGSPSSLSLAQWVGTGFGVLVGSFITYYAALPSHVEFDAERGEVRWRHVGWPGRAAGSCPLGQITEVQLLEDEHGLKRLALTTDAGVVPLTRHLTAFERHTENATTVREWLMQYKAGA